MTMRNLMKLLLRCEIVGHKIEFYLDPLLTIYFSPQLEFSNKDKVDVWKICAFRFPNAQPCFFSSKGCPFSNRTQLRVSLSTLCSVNRDYDVYFPQNTIHSGTSPFLKTFQVAMKWCPCIVLMYVWRKTL